MNQLMNPHFFEMMKEVKLSDQYPIPKTSSAEDKARATTLQAAHIRAAADYQGNKEIAESNNRVAAAITSAASEGGSYGDGRLLAASIISLGIIFSAARIASTTQFHCSVNPAQDVSTQIEDCREAAGHIEGPVKLTIDMSR